MTSEHIFKDDLFKACHAPSIVQTEEGLVVAFFSGKLEGHRSSSIWVSRYREDQWTLPVEVAVGATLSGTPLACWNPVLFQEPNNQITLFYKVGKSPMAWTGMYITSDDNGYSWSEAHMLPHGVFGPSKNKPILLEEGHLLCPSSEEKSGAWGIHFEIRHKSAWRRIDVEHPQQFSCIQPTILQHSVNILQALCRSKNRKIIETWSYDKGLTWRELKKTALSNPNSAIDGVSIAHDKHLLVYNNCSVGRFNLELAASNDGQAWELIQVLENEKGEFSYPAIIVDDSGIVHIVYSWNRRRIKHRSFEISAIF